MKPSSIGRFNFYKPVVSIIPAITAMVLSLVASVSAEVPDTNSYWKNFSAIEQQARQQLAEAGRNCRGRSGSEAEAALKEWLKTAQPSQYPGSDFNPCSISGTLVIGNNSIQAADGRALKFSEGGALQTEWNFRSRTVNLWFNGDHISLKVSPIAVSVVRAALGAFGGAKVSGLSLAETSEKQIIGGLENFWRSAHEHYPNHSMYDIALQVLTGKDEGREMLADYIRCGKSLCE